MSEELEDPFSLPDGADGYNDIYLGADDIEDLGHASVTVRTKNDGTGGTFDSVQVVELAGEPTILAKRAIEAEGRKVLIPTQVIPWDQVTGIRVPIGDGRLEQVDGELIGVDPGVGP